jgi:hypothetical protein
MNIEWAQVLVAFALGVILSSMVRSKIPGGSKIPGA